MLKYPQDYPELDKAGTVFYVGKGKGYIINVHESQAKTGVDNHKCNTIRKIWNSGCQVDKEILSRFATHKEACMYEIALVFFLPNLTNMTIGGDGTRDMTGDIGRKISQLHQGKLRGPHSEETRRKMSESNRGRVRTEETRRRIGESHKGQVQSEETRRKKSEALKGRTFSEESLQKMRDALERRKDIPSPLKGKPGKPHSEETRRKMSESKKGKSIVPHTEEWKRKVSEANKGRFVGRKHSEEAKRKISEASKRASNIEHLRKLSEANKGRKLSEEHRRKIIGRPKGISRKGRQGATNNPTIIVDTFHPEAYTQGLLFPQDF